MRELQLRMPLVPHRWNCHTCKSAWLMPFKYGEIWDLRFISLCHQFPLGHFLSCLLHWHTCKAICDVMTHKGGGTGVARGALAPPNSISADNRLLPISSLSRQPPWSYFCSAAIDDTDSFPFRLTTITSRTRSLLATPLQPMQLQPQSSAQHASDRLPSWNKSS